jgi:signal peptidase I
MLSFFKKKKFNGGDSQGNIPSPSLPIRYSDIKYEDGLLTVKIKPPVQIFAVSDTNSMEPLIDAGHFVVVSSHPDYMDAIKLGSVILYQAIGGMMLHSVIKTGNDGRWYCRTQGLNCADRDNAIVRKENIIGVAVMPVWGEGAD